jgi:hypothetical protein
MAISVDAQRGLRRVRNPLVFSSLDALKATTIGIGHHRRMQELSDVAPDSLL